MSFGTSFTPGAEYTFACENGVVTVGRSKVTVTPVGEKEGKTTNFPDEGSGVHQEVKAWAQSLLDGKPDPMQSPEQALGDLEIMEKMLRSGESSGKTETLQLQL
jgi:predicted dehydrogenase